MPKAIINIDHRVGGVSAMMDLTTMNNTINEPTRKNAQLKRDELSSETILTRQGLGWLSVGLALGWLMRHFTISASDGAINVAVAVIIAMMISATIFQFSCVIRPLLRWYLGR